MLRRLLLGMAVAAVALPAHAQVIIDASGIRVPGVSIGANGALQAPGVRVGGDGSVEVDDEDGATAVSVQPGGRGAVRAPSKPVVPATQAPVMRPNPVVTVSAPPAAVPVAPSYVGMPLMQRDFRGMDLTGAAFTGANVSGSLFTGVSLRGASFVGADVSGADFTGADLRGADFTGAILGSTVLTGARIDGGEFQGADTSRTVGLAPAAPGVQAPTRVVSAANIAAAMAQPTARALDLTVAFAFDRADLAPQGRRQVAEMAAALKASQLAGQRFVIEGHTDDKGSDAYNLDLSRRRAMAVVNELVDVHGVELARLQAVGHGKSRPRVSNANEEGRALNRRVTLVPAR